MQKKIHNALISVYHKDGLDEIVHKLNELNVEIYSTGGTYDYIKGLGIEAKSVESLTGYPSIFGGRVKTLHPKVFGGILYRRENNEDLKQAVDYAIPPIDLVIVDLYPFEETVRNTNDEAAIIEKIDIGGISLIRAAAKNFNDVVCVSSSSLYPSLMELLCEKEGFTSLENRKFFAAHAFNTSSHYDTAIFNYFNRNQSVDVFKRSIDSGVVLRYGENPHQKACFYGKFDDMFTKLNGKEISYNNLLDIDAAVSLMHDFDETTFAVIKHNNACGLASRPTVLEAWKDALAGDPVSAFGGILITNAPIDAETANEINKIFFEVLIAPDYDVEALNVLKSKKNRIILLQKEDKVEAIQYKSLLNGVVEQERDLKVERASELEPMTNKQPTVSEVEDLLFANKLVKHTKSNAIVLAKNKQLLASGMGQTSRVDSLRQAIEKAGRFGFDLHGAVMASDAFFPFADCVEIANQAGITAVIQPGGSIRDNDSVDYCNNHDMAMVKTGFRHFKH